MDNHQDDDVQWMEVLNVTKLLNFSRKLVFYNFDSTYSSLDDEEFILKVGEIKLSEEPEVDKLLPYKECLLMFNEHLHRRKRKNDSKRYTTYIKDADYDLFLEQLCERMVSNTIQSLVNKGLVETAYDSEKNDFIFWVKKGIDYGDFPTDEI